MKELRQEHLSALRPVWWEEVLVCSRPAYESAGPVNLAQLRCLFGLTLRSPRGYSKSSLKGAFVLQQKSVTNIYRGGEREDLALRQPDSGRKIHRTFLNLSSFQTVANLYPPFINEITLSKIIGHLHCQCMDFTTPLGREARRNLMPSEGNTYVRFRSPDTIEI